MLRKVCFHINEICSNIKRIYLHIQKKHGKQARQILATNNHGKFLLHTPTVNSGGKQPWQILTANSHGKFPRHIAMADSRGKQPWQILATNSQDKFSNRRLCGVILSSSLCGRALRVRMKKAAKQKFIKAYKANQSIKIC